MNEDKKTDQQILKEKTLEKAKEVIGLSLESAINEIWKAKNRVVKDGGSSMSVSCKLTLDKISDDKLHVVCEPAWTESHKGAKKSGEVTLQEDLFEEPDPPEPLT